ncbi:MAG: NAD(P)H-quinone oxidoreductase [Actinomycetota bacterium]|nr:NAD(P)H-quinone oxidoreductase [Actinomycetota bacterium]
MYAITLPSFGGPEVLTWTEVDDPTCGPSEIVIDIAASAVNRADIMQRQGFYPPPPGASDIPGLECSGVVSEVGSGLSGWAVGDQVCALLAGGGYAERVNVPAAQVLPLPARLELVPAGGLPEVTCTVWSNVVMLAGLNSGDTLLVHGGSSGIGTSAIQIARLLGATVYVTVGSQSKADFCLELGAAAAITYREEDFVERVAELTDGRGVDVILDNMGASYLGRNISALAMDGRLVIIGMQGGRKGELDMGALLAKRGSVHATGLRARPIEGPTGKGAIVAAVRENVWPAVADGRVRPIVDQVIPMPQAAEAHRIVESSTHIGKVLLEVPRSVSR